MSSSQNQPPEEPLTSLESLPTPLTAEDRLLTVYRRTGPYVSAYLTLGDTIDGRLDRRILVMLDELREQGASDAALRAVESRLSLPPPPDVVGIGIVAADDGTTVVDYGLEPPFQDYGVVDTLPHVAPLLEWHQHRVPHVVMTIDDQGADLAIFGLDHFSALERLADHREVLARATEVCRALRIELAIITGRPEHTAGLADALIASVDPRCRVVIEPHHDDVDDLVDVTVRLVNDAAARRTVGLLREHRFLDEHDSAVDGRHDTVAELVDGTASQLLVHDSWIDQERIWVGSEPNELSTSPRDGYRSARLVDAVIWSAILQGVPVHIIPTTGPNGPDENTGAITAEPPQFTN